MKQEKPERAPYWLVLVAAVFLGALAGLVADAMTLFIGIVDGRGYGSTVPFSIIAFVLTFTAVYLTEKLVDKIRGK